MSSLILLSTDYHWKWVKLRRLKQSTWRNKEICEMITFITMAPSPHLHVPRAYCGMFVPPSYSFLTHSIVGSVHAFHMTTPGHCNARTSGAWPSRHAADSASKSLSKFTHSVLLSRISQFLINFPQTEESLIDRILADVSKNLKRNKSIMRGVQSYWQVCAVSNCRFCTLRETTRLCKVLVFPQILRVGVGNLGRRQEPDI